MRKILCLVLGLAVLASGCSVLGDSARAELPVVGSAENLRALLAAQQKEFDYKFRGELALDGAEAEPAGAGGRDYSDTNVQVEGIDEADIVKTDGTYIYHIAGNKVLITRVWPAPNLEIVQELEEPGFTPSTLYVDDKHLVVIGMEQSDEYPSQVKGEERLIRPTIWQNTRVLIYDISDMDHISLSRDVSVDGYNINSRKKGDYIYLVNSRNVGWLQDGQDPARPWYKDSASGEKKIEIDYQDIRYFPDMVLNDYVIFAALDLEAGKLEVETYLGWAQNMYMSHENLYIAMLNEMNTSVFRFAVDGLELNYTGEGTVAGTPLNQFSMDEHDGYFRIATTDCTDWENTSNNLYVLDSGMKVVGQINDIAPGEQIYSARFMGDKAYLVTFEMVDPLFVIDLADPRNPEILGELKIPGFSNYLHPLDDNHLLGIGQDTMVGSLEGREFVTTKGMKLAIFDVTDVNNPKEKHVETLGGQGTWSEALYNHKAVFFHNGILGLPISITKETEDYNWNYQFTGALFYNVDLESGFTELGRISHVPESSGDDWYYTPDVQRIVQIEDVYYTVSELLLMAHNADFEKLAEVDLPAHPGYLR